MPRHADFRALARHQIVRRIYEVVADARILQIAHASQRVRSFPRFFFPIARGPVGIDARLDLHHRGRLRKIVDFGRLCQAAQEGLLQRHLRERFLVCLVGGKPQILAERSVVAIDAHLPGRPEESAESVFADEIRAVEVVVADADAGEHEAVACCARGKDRAEGSDHLAIVDVEKLVLNVERLRSAGDFKARARAVHFIVHGVQRLILVLDGRLRARGDWRGGATFAAARRRFSPRSFRARRTAANAHGANAAALPSTARTAPNISTARARIIERPLVFGSWPRDRGPAAEVGGLSVEIPFFCTSSSEIKMAGAAAATGTEPIGRRNNR